MTFLEALCEVSVIAGVVVFAVFALIVAGIFVRDASIIELLVLAVFLVLFGSAFALSYFTGGLGL